MKSDLILILEAACFAADKHRRQRRKDVEATPYINHSIQVATILAVEGGVQDVEIIAAALLHDVVEDTGTSIVEIGERFGRRVASIVNEVTDNKDLLPAERKRRQITSAKLKSYGAKLVNLADKIANVRDITSAPPADWGCGRKANYCEWSKEVIDQLRGTNRRLEVAFDKSEGIRLCLSASQSTPLEPVKQVCCEPYSGKRVKRK
jgi:guanosine-3',5'-bis(diphosphate) 3'-pyrophosphohydrolase